MASHADRQDRFQPWTVLGSRTHYDHPPFVNVRVETVRLPDGKVLHDYHQITLPEVGVVLAVDTQQRLLMLRQYRHGVRRDCMCLPGGALLPGELPLAGAERELLEETGLKAAQWQVLGSAAPNANYGCGMEYYFLATGLELVQPPNSGDLEETDIVWMTRAEVEEMVDRQEALVTGVLAGALLYLRHVPDKDGSR